MIISSSNVYEGTELGDMAPLISKYFDPGKYIIFSSGRIYRLRRRDNATYASPIMLGYNDGSTIAIGYTIIVYMNITTPVTLWLWNPSGHGSNTDINVGAQNLALYSYYIGPN